MCAGIMTANPKVVPSAQPVPFVSFEEASELAYFGAEILHPIRYDTASPAINQQAIFANHHVV